MFTNCLGKNTFFIVPCHVLLCTIVPNGNFTDFFFREFNFLVCEYKLNCVHKL